MKTKSIPVSEETHKKIKLVSALTGIKVIEIVESILAPELKKILKQEMKGIINE